MWSEQGCAFGDWTGKARFQGFLPEQAWRATTLALENGIRCYDMAYAYGTHRHVGDVLAREFMAGNLKREDLFLTTKLAHPRSPPHVAISHQLTYV
jgi:diketogulonate reductase-like aldo/keto reductase